MDGLPKAFKSSRTIAPILAALVVCNTACGSTATDDPASAGSSSGGAKATAGGAGAGGSQPNAVGGNTSAGSGTSGGQGGVNSGPMAGSAGAPPGGGGAAGTSPAGSAGAGTGGGIIGDMPLVYDVENTGADCPAAPAQPAFEALTAVPNMPDPFASIGGAQITSREQWRCRRAEISSVMQHWVSGPKGAPPADLSATFSGNKLSVVVTQGGASITLSATLSVPSGSGPFPLIIGMNTATGSLPSSLFAGVATLAFTSSQLVPDGFNVTRGAGTYFKMYPDQNAGAMIEWAWGVSRIIDGLYKTKDQNHIDLSRIGVTGCSYQGKMSLYAGAFDERIALVMPEESGGGGEASWRVMATQSGTEDLEAAQGTAWYAANLKKFKNADAPKLPVDMHELVAMVAPRAILIVANTGIDRLGSEAGYASMKAATEVYKALGIPERIGFTQAQASSHCSFPSSQGPDVQAFVNRFLLGKTDATAIAKSPYKTDMTKWITWSTPTLK
jgi:predicted secreted protein